jgi:hypothetical protein
MHYIIKLDEKGYFDREKPYTYVSKEEASKISSKDICRHVAWLRRLGYNTACRIKIEDK